MAGNGSFREVSLDQGIFPPSNQFGYTCFFYTCWKVSLSWITSRVFQFCTFLSIALRNSSWIFASALCLSPCNFFHVIYLIGLFLSSLRSHILLQNCFDSFASTCWFVLHQNWESHHLGIYLFVSIVWLGLNIFSVSFLLAIYFDLSLKHVISDFSLVLSWSLNPNIS